MFNNRLDYKIALLWLLDALPNHSGRSMDVQKLFLEKHQEEIPQEDFRELPSGGYRWAKEVQWSRYECVQSGLMDSPSTGVWRLTEQGRQWLRENRDDRSLDLSPPKRNLLKPEINKTNLEMPSGSEDEPKMSSMLEVFGDFFVPLMRILDGLPNRAGQSGEVLLLFERAYREQIAPDLYTQNQSKHIRWEHNVRWSREKLKLLGFVDAPQYGIWRLTEKGHQWLVDHPEATHLSVGKAKSGQMTKSTRFVHSQNAPEIESNTAMEFLASLQTALDDPLKTVFGSIYYEFIQRSNYLQIRLAGFAGCHYEIILRRTKHEIALHFESSAERSKARLRGFEPHIDSLSQTLNMPIYAGDFQTRGWTQVRIETRSRPFLPSLANEYAHLVTRFVVATLPILKNIYTGEKAAQTTTNKVKVATSYPMHAILDQEVANVRAYLEGRTSLQVSDEKLCDWINFCYLFGMYTEGRDLFALVNGAEVNPWYFERTKRIVKVCDQKANLLQARNG